MLFNNIISHSISLRYCGKSIYTLAANNSLVSTYKNFFSTRIRRERPPPITVTENAANRLKELLSNKSDSLGIIIGVKRRGCNGYSYTMNYATAADIEAKKDAKDAYESVHTHGVSVYVDPKALFSIVGTEMDYEETALASEFTFNNPNSKGSCGCGESFNV